VPSAARGLDFPNVSHVYSLGACPDAATYAHVAGRCGRVGQAARGVVTTLGSAADREVLAAQLEEVGAGAPEDLPAPPAPDGDRERLEETGALL